MRSQIKPKEYRVYGPPGTGKTTWIVNKANECAELYGRDQISLCSLTNTAVKEVAGRKIDVEDNNISTLHARCKRSLMAPAPAESKVKDFVKDNPKWSSTDGMDPCLPASMVRGIKSEDGEDLSETIYVGGKQISLYEKAQISRQQLVPKSEWPHSVLRWFKVWDDWCRQTGHLDFTGWLEAALEVRPLPHQQVVFIDEAQDHTPLQLAVIRSWSAKNIVLVGDDDQNLYEWSGAIPSHFFGTELEEGREKVLEKSHRVPVEVHAVADAWIKRVSNRKVKKYTPKDLQGEVIYPRYSLSNVELAGDLPEDLLSEDNKTYMFLTSCGYMLDSVIHLLRSKSIAFHNPYRRSNKRWNPLDTPKDVVEDYARVSSAGGCCGWTGAELENWVKVLKTRGVFYQGKKQDLMTLCDKMNSRIIDLEDLSEFFLPHMMNRIASRDLSIFREFRKVGVSGSWDYALDIFSRRREDWEPRVIVGTIHSVKGGEANNVYLFPELSPAGYMDMLSSNSDRILRLFYVGMTRASERLVLCDQSHRLGKAINW